MSKKQFSPETWMDISFQVSEDYKNLEDEILQYRYKMLLNGMNADYDKWFERQMAQTDIVNRGIIGIIKKHRANILSDTKNAFKEASFVATGLVEESIEEKPIVVSNDAAVKERLGLVDENFKLLLLSQQRSTASLPAKIFANVNATPGHTTWTMEKHLEELHKAIEVGYKRELPNMTKVTYSNGREVSFKSYAEMAIRTEINNVAVDMMQEGSKGLGIVLFLCSYLSDCAPDHAPYQGKVYILKDWKSIIPVEQHSKYEELIQSQDIKTLEWAKEEGTYTVKSGKTYKIALGTRPNCRHTFTPITYDQALNPSKAMNELGNRSVGKYDKDKYIASQQQRAYERKIRELKLDYNNRLQDVKKSKTEEEAMRFNAQLDSISKQIRETQKALREFLKSHAYLDRQYQRENPLRMATNLGIEN